MTYSQKLRSPQWQRKRLEIMRRDNFACQLCGDLRTELHIHHKVYQPDFEPWEYPDEVYLTLCKYCHFLVTKFPIDADWYKIVRVAKLKITDTLISVFALCDIKKRGKDFIYAFHIIDKLGEEMYMEMKTLLDFEEFKLLSRLFKSQKPETRG